MFMQPQTCVAIHSLVLGMAGDEAVANHRAYARSYGYRHEIHICDGGGATDRTRLLRKYSKILSLLRAASEHQILVFVEDSVAFSTPLAIPDVLGTAPYWLCQDGHWRDRGNGGLIIVRGGPEGVAVVEDMLGRCQALAPDRQSFSRWEHVELMGLQTHDHDTLIAGCYPNLLFPSFGHAMPGVRALAVAFNPHVLPHAQDHHANALAIRHLTERLEQRQPAFAFDPVAPDESPEHAFLEGRTSRVGIVLVVEPGQDDAAALVESNLRLYARHHGYALTVRCEAFPRGANRLAAMLRHVGNGSLHHAFVLCLTADVLIHDLARPIETMFGDASLLLARFPWGNGADDGMIALRCDETGKALIAAALQDDTDFEALLGLTMAGKAGRFEDLVSWAAHHAFRDPANFLIRYEALPANIRQLVMRQDAVALPERLAPPPDAPPAKTSLSFFRHPRLNLIVSGIIAIAMLITLVQQLR